MERLESTNIACLLQQMAQQRPHQAAVYNPAGRDHAGRPRYTRLTFQQLDQQSDQLARGLRSYGITGGVKTVLMVRPSLEFFVLTFALFKAGAIPVMVDPGMGVRKLRACITEAAPEAFIGIPKAHLARQLLGWGRGSLRLLVTVGPGLPQVGIRYAQIVERGLDLESPEPLYIEGDPDEMAAILFTSGSTGVPKGAVYTHRIFISQVQRLQAMYGIEPGEVDLSTFPLFALFAPALGMTAVIPEMDPTRPAEVDPDKIFEAITHFGVNNMFGSPALIRRIAEDDAAARMQLPSLRRVISAGAPVPASVLDQFQPVLAEGVEIHTPYGATEALPVSTIGSREILQETRFQTEVGRGICVGRPVEKTLVRVIGISEAPIACWSDRLSLDAGAIGEICVFGSQVTAQYYGRDESTVLAKIEDLQRGGVWHRMGDVGYFDDEGRLWFCGRKSHRVIGRKRTWYTIPVEAVFNTHEAVFRTALVGVGRSGRQKPVLCVELTDDVDTNSWPEIESALREIGERFAHTAEIDHFLLHPKFPVDIRHNAKIFREKLARWARRRVRR